MKLFATLILATLTTTAHAADFVPYEKTYRTPDDKIVKVVDTKSRNGKLRCQVGEVPEAGGLNVLENRGWIDCSELRATRAEGENRNAKKAHDYPYAQDAEDLNEAGEILGQ